jgi:hypothetical protein
MLKKYFILSILLVFGLSFTCFPKYSAADSASQSTDGFIIEADAVEGVMGVPEIINGETSTSQNKLMLRVNYTHARIIGLKLTKVLNTPSGPVTIQMKASGPVELNRMSVDTTKLEFGGIYVPKIGEIGMKDVRLVAHKQTAGTADLKGLNVSFVKAASVDTTSDSDDALKSLSDKLTELISAKGLAPGSDSQQLINKLLTGADQKNDPSSSQTKETKSNNQNTKAQRKPDTTGSASDAKKPNDTRGASNSADPKKSTEKNTKSALQCITDNLDNLNSEDKTSNQHSKNSTSRGTGHDSINSQTCPQNQTKNDVKSIHSSNNQTKAISTGTSGDSGSAASNGTNSKSEPPGASGTGTGNGGGASTTNPPLQDPPSGSSSDPSQNGKSGASNSNQDPVGGLFGLLKNLIP